VENRDYSKCSRDTVIRIRKFMEGLLDEWSNRGTRRQHNI
jgi:hypothetical protein